MKDKAIAYLMKNPLLHMGMIEAIHRDTVDLLYADTDGVLLKELKSNAYMITVDNIEKGQELLNRISECNLIVTHQNYMVEYIKNRFSLTENLECTQAAYLDKVRLNVNEELEIKMLEPKHLKVILEHYKKLSSYEVEELLKSGSLFGGYKNGTLIGFVGNHLEGSIGLLEIFPDHRRMGYGSTLISSMVNNMLDKGLVPFGQIETYNKKSFDLHKKLGFKISEDRLYWIF